MYDQWLQTKPESLYCSFFVKVNQQSRKIALEFFFSPLSFVPFISAQQYWCFVNASLVPVDFSSQNVWLEWPLYYSLFFLWWVLNLSSVMVLLQYIYIMCLWTLSAAQACAENNLENNTVSEDLKYWQTWIYKVQIHVFFMTLGMTACTRFAWLNIAVNLWIIPKAQGRSQR